MSENTEERLEQLADEQDDMKTSEKDQLYYAAKDGLSLVVFSLLAKIKSEDARNAIINQVCIVHRDVGLMSVHRR